MWHEKIIKVIPVMLFLFCLLEIFELGLAINEMNKTEKLEVQLRQALEESRIIVNSLSKHSKHMELEIFQKK